MHDSQPAVHILDAAVALTPEGTNNYTGHTSPAYANMVGPFGGTIGATLLNAVMLHPERLGDPLTLTVNFAAPIADGTFSVLARVMRTNRSTQHWMVELQQDGQVAAFATAITAIRRDTWSETDADFPLAPPPAQVAQSPAHPRAAWTACYEMRFISGMPGQPASDTGGHPSETRLWIRDQPPRPLDFLSLTAMCDAFYPRVLLRRPSWTPAGTVALTTYFHADAAQLQAHGDAPLLGAARGLRFNKGFFDQSAEMWTPAGVLLATSHQVVYFKE
jgi:hypothetical protein